MFFTGIFSAQVSGSLIDPADLVVNPLDPNGNGFVTFTGLQFCGAYDQSEFEIPFLALQQFKPGSGPDNQFLMSCELYELVSDAASNAYPGYYYFSIPEGIADNRDKNGSVRESGGPIFYISKAMDFERITGS